MNTGDVLFDLCRAPGLSGREGTAAALAAELLRPLTDEVRTDKLGSVIAIRKSAAPDAPVLLFDAHIDQIGMVTTGITDEGFLRFHAIGLDPRCLFSQAVRVMTEEGELSGVIACLPPHVLDAAEAEKPVAAADCVVDIGYTGAEAKKRVRIGDPILFDTTPAELSDGSVTAAAIDDRGGLAAILHALELTKDKALPVNLVVLASVQEETGLRGATVGAFSIEPDCAVVVDVGHAATPDSGADETFDYRGGPPICVGPAIHGGMAKALMQAAERRGIAYAVEVTGGPTGTNAWRIQIAREGIPCGMVSIPLKYMHTPSEVCRIADIEGVGAILAAFAEAFCWEVLA